MGNFSLNERYNLPWLQNTDDAICFICKEDIESVTHFFSTALISETILNLSGIMKIKIARCNPIDGAYICNFIKNLDRNNRVLLLLREFALPFDNETNILTDRFISSAVCKIHKLHNERLRELEAPRLVNQSHILMFCYFTL